MKIVAVIVTYNRLEKLKTALMSYELQTKYCSDLVVVNNCSTDGTEDYLNRWEQEPSCYKRHVIKTDSNIGGAGGFFTGMKYALMINADWVWLADDDAYPEKDCFEKLYKFIYANKSIDNISAICSSVIKTDGNVDVEHRGSLSHGLYWKRKNSIIENYQLEEFKIDLLSYVGSTLNAKALKEVGLCEKDYFIYFDDSEHSMRLRKYGEILCIPSIRVVHDVPEETLSSDGRNYGWKTYYNIRNVIYSYMQHHKLTAIVWILRIVLWQNCLFMAGRINKESIKLMMTAVLDGYNKKLGMHNLYKPGFKNE